MLGSLMLRPFARSAESSEIICQDFDIDLTISISRVNISHNVLQY